ncbi:DnaJ domain-containing protein [Cryptosporidium ubiquitum]|uniref:DnaJ domain-containing protein n=1 Tax=Cryptosporidium ubiquitum TaxID=857276 RepID=A0A1J4MLU8_9CRYT|nr:DnaJ domain-containing protein [Cryptosporidium ubiquitum]OII75242.1 DnaJ domain-containing protein [Cryptosporidium ubiquitum]
MFSDRLKEYQKSRKDEKSNIDNVLNKESKKLQEIGIGIRKLHNNIDYTKGLINKSSGSRSSNSSVDSSNLGVNNACSNINSFRMKLEDISSKISYSPSVISNDSKTKSDYVHTLRSQNNVYKRRELISDHENFGDHYSQVNYKKRNLEDYNSPNEKYNNKSPINEFRMLNKRVLISHKYYDILELQPGSNLESIKKAYRKKASKLHPDKLVLKNPDQKEKSLAKFRQVQESYEFLSNPNKKELYDEYGDDILKYGFLDHWNEMKGIFETKVPNYNEMNNNINQTKFSNIRSDWDIFWQEVLVHLFFKPILNKNSIELRDLPPMNISVTNYKTLISNSYMYLKRLLSIPSSFFGNPIVINLDPIDDLNIVDDKTLPMLKKGLFSRFANFNTQKTKFSNNFVNAQIIGYNTNSLVINKDTVGLAKISSNKTSVNEAFGIIFCESKQGWGRFLNLAKKEFESKNGNTDNYNSSDHLINQNFNNFKRRLKEIQAEFDWVILVFLSEEQLPSQDQELLLDYYNIKDDIKDIKDSGDVNNLDIIEEKVDESQASDLFPCLIQKSKNSNLSNRSSDISYSRPSNAQINQIIKQLELLSNIDSDLNNHPIIDMIASEVGEAPCVGKGGKHAC